MENLGEKLNEMLKNRYRNNEISKLKLNLELTDAEKECFEALIKNCESDLFINIVRLISLTTHERFSEKIENLEIENLRTSTLKASDFENVLSEKHSFVSEEFIEKTLDAIKNK